MYLSLSLSTYIYIYICTYIYRERERYICCTDIGWETCEQLVFSMSGCAHYLK